MITNHTLQAYSSPLSSEFVKDYKEIVTTRLRVTQQSVKASEEKIQRTIDPELTEIFNKGASSAIDLYA